jgi:hypothetical protein
MWTCGRTRLQFVAQFKLSSHKNFSHGVTTNHNPSVLRAGKLVAGTRDGTPRTWQTAPRTPADSVAALDRAFGPHRTGMCIDAELNAFVLSSDILALLAAE